MLLLCMIFAPLKWTFLFYSKVQSGFIWSLVDMIFHIMWVIYIIPNLKCSFEYEIILCLCKINDTVLSFREYDTIQMEFKHEFSLKYTLFSGNVIYEMFTTHRLITFTRLHIFIMCPSLRKLEDEYFTIYLIHNFFCV